MNDMRPTISEIDAANATLPGEIASHNKARMLLATLLPIIGVETASYFVTAKEAAEIAETTERIDRRKRDISNGNR